MKILILSTIAFMLCVACETQSSSNIGKRWHSETETQYYAYDKACLEGVVYWHNGHQLSVAFNRDSTVQTCEER